MRHFLHYFFVIFEGFLNRPVDVETSIRQAGARVLFLMQKYTAEIVGHVVGEIIEAFELKYQEVVGTAFRMAFTRELDDVNDCIAEFQVSLDDFRVRMQKYRIFPILHQFSSGGPNWPVPQESSLFLDIR
jgi:hypothetical protein